MIYEFKHAVFIADHKSVSVRLFQLRNSYPVRSCLKVLLLRETQHYRGEHVWVYGLKILSPGIFTLEENNPELYMLRCLSLPPTPPPPFLPLSAFQINKSQPAPVIGRLQGLRYKGPCVHFADRTETKGLEEHRRKRSGP